MSYMSNNSKMFFPKVFVTFGLDYIWCRCMPRLHLGMTFTSIKLLDPVCIERMKHKHNIKSGLIVQQV